MRRKEPLLVVIGRDAVECRGEKGDIRRDGAQVFGISGNVVAGCPIILNEHHRRHGGAADKDIVRYVAVPRRGKRDMIERGSRERREGVTGNTWDMVDIVKR